MGRGRYKLIEEVEYIHPDQVQVGDIVMCYRHDDQRERNNARIVGIERENTSGILLVGGVPYHFSYRISFLCRHISLKDLDAFGGPLYRWHFFPWNGIVRYTNVRWPCPC